MSPQPLVPPGPALTAAEIGRYSRHLLLPEVGQDGQRRLAAARVLVVGAGGLAAPVLSYAAAAGVGHLTVVDDDAVDVSNLQRQVIHRTADVGVAKVRSAERAVRELNPGVEVVGVAERVSADNALELFADHDVIVDATDNFATRYLVNDACVLLGLPLVWGAIHRFDGQVSVWWAGEGPCYRCVFPVAPPVGAVPSCAEAGVLGSIPGVIGSTQATEIVKLILGIGRPLTGRMLVHDALAGDWSSVPVARDPDCPVCGEHPTIRSLTDSASSCMSQVPSPVAPAPTVTARELARLVAVGEPVRVVDVRSDAERSIAVLPFGSHVELSRLEDGGAFSDVTDLAGDEPVVFYCKSGVRSARAVQLAAGRGISARSLDGGILAWIADIDPSLTAY
ncbi:molybdopterin-synthase adenylyltransferase MoeB [Rudaeicoccus suwonensis]|uniref:Adenylyltransferase/sulfurtransferase n=1 Tax=Rudaeicoccus suwonensis TaxID=657409 RepID=A0A561E1A9_9MICO|nr:molybdopterin-synthase adenylyltransferase MoeB [Rudaeicoccus suwonensis]TWE09382.1 adenylyltransferase/sulfurtransferase [Rudaeicoccus suwonensis]